MMFVLLTFNNLSDVVYYYCYSYSGPLTNQYDKSNIIVVLYVICPDKR